MMMITKLLLLIAPGTIQRHMVHPTGQVYLRPRVDLGRINRRIYVAIIHHCRADMSRSSKSLFYLGRRCIRSWYDLSRDPVAGHFLVLSGERACIGGGIVDLSVVEVVGHVAEITVGRVRLLLLVLIVRFWRGTILAGVSNLFRHVAIVAMDGGARHAVRVRQVIL